ncbi:hypothetical protein [Caballeronia choica]|jgi:hypothetical protein|nr:hypothetical protein [Caballeronia choica]
MFAFNETLEHLDASEVANVPKAVANAEALMREVIATLNATEPVAT